MYALSLTVVASWGLYCLSCSKAPESATTVVYCLSESRTVDMIVCSVV